MGFGRGGLAHEHRRPGTGEEAGGQEGSDRAVDRRTARLHRDAARRDRANGSRHRRQTGPSQRRRGVFQEVAAGFNVKSDDARTKPPLTSPAEIIRPSAERYCMKAPETEGPTMLPTV